MEDEGYRSLDPIWSHHYHGMGRENTFVPDDLVRTAAAIFKSHVIVAQSVGVKDRFMGEIVNNEPIHDAATFNTRCQSDLDNMVAKLKDVFAFPEDDSANIIVASSLREWGWGKVMSSKTMGYELSKPNDSWLNSSPPASWYIKYVILRYEWRKTSITRLCEYALWLTQTYILQKEGICVVDNAK